MSNWEDFELGFWHPFGPHAMEPPEKILARKRRETEENGWTLWSFNHTNLEVWYQELIAASPPSVFAFCGTWKKVSDPGGPGSVNTNNNSTRFQFIGSSCWQPVPQSIKVPHPFKPGKREASAFVVESVEFPIQSFRPPSLEWFSKDERLWKQDVRKRRDGTLLPYFYPTHGEILIRRGGTHPMRKVSAILKLKPPYLASVGIDG